MFKSEWLLSNAMLIFKDRIISIICNSPLCDEQVAVVELVATTEGYAGGVCLRDIISFTGLINCNSDLCYVREQSADVLELWLFARKENDFDDDPTPVNMFV